MKTFDDLEFEHRADLNGEVSRLMFPNGYGVSVVRHQYSYGGKKGLYELAVLDNLGVLCYTTPVTSDVEGYLSPENVTQLMGVVQQLP